MIETPNETAFFSKSPIEILREGKYNKVPIIMGYTETEGMLFEQKKLSAAKAGLPIPDFKMEYIIPYELNVKPGSDDCKEICETLDKLYSSISDDRHYHVSINWEQDEEIDVFIGPSLNNAK